VEVFVGQLVAQMTLEEKVGQLIQADVGSITPEELRRYRLGAVLAGGNTAPEADLRAPASKWLALTDAYFRASIADPPRSHPPIPVLFGIDAVHGHAHVRGATIFPHNIGLGATHDPALIEAIGRATAEEIAATGIDWTFAPTVAVVRDPRWGRSYESYSEDPEAVADDARALVTGLQGRPGTADYLAAGHTLATLKHFVGDGGTRAGRDQADNPADEATLRRVHAAAYPAAIAAGALVVMASYSGWQGVKMHANLSLLTGVLKDRWGFPGFVVGDWNAHEEIPGCTKYSCPRMLAAGIDLYMAPDSWRQLYANLLRQARRGDITPARLDDAVRRILRVKALMGLFEARPPGERPAPAPAARLGSSEHRALARRAVRESLVLLRNTGHLLPLDPGASVLVAGSAADDLGMQCGGWTVDWQGDHNRNADFPGATSLLAGIRATVAAAGGSVVFSPDGSFRERPSAAVVVFGETPYAEYQGDRETLAYSTGDPGPLAILRRLRAAGIPVVSVLLSGRPLWVNPELNASDAFVVAWLPGSEGEGVADLLFRGPAEVPAREFTGRLGFSWPATAMPVRFTAAGSPRGALFERGFGLRLASAPDAPLRPEDPPLSEDPKIPRALNARDTLFHAAHVTAPWSMFIGDATAELRVTTPAQTSPARIVRLRLGTAALRASWSGHGSGMVRIGGRALDLAGSGHARAAVVLRYRVEVPPTAAVRAGVLCEAPYGTDAETIATRDWGRCGVAGGAMLDLTSRFRSAPPGRWQTLAIPLAGIARTGADLRSVSSPFALETRGRLRVSIAEVRLERNAAAGDRERAPSPAGG
jgi:beta-glucosidase